MFKGRREPVAFLWVVAQPMKQLRKIPTRRSTHRRTIDCLEVILMRKGRDLGGFLFRPVIAPEVILVEWNKILVNRNYRRTGGVESDGFNLVSIDSGLANRQARGFCARMWSP
jgi:hypothetical protein